jgi:hypothetical protein
MALSTAVSSPSVWTTCDMKFFRSSLSIWEACVFHQPRLRREAYGELIQIDGSEHRWFEDRGAPCSLLVFIDDATGKLMQLRFVPSERTSSYFDCFGQALGVPYEPRCARRSGHDAVRPRLSRAEHRDHLRELQPGQGPRGTSQPYALGTLGESVTTRRCLRHGSWQHLPAGVSRTLQREVFCSCRQAGQPASPADREP